MKKIGGSIDIETQVSVDTDFDGRSTAVNTFAAGGAAESVDLTTTGVWGLVIFADGGVQATAGAVAIDWLGPAPQGFDLAAESVSINPGLALAPGDILDVTRAISNLGAQDGPAYTYEIFLSADSTIDPAVDTKIFTSPSQTALTAGGLNADTVFVTLPQNLVNGVYYVGLWVPQLGSDADTSNAQVVSAETVAITGGFANATARDASASRRSGGGGGGSGVGGAGGGEGGGRDAAGGDASLRGPPRASARGGGEPGRLQVALSGAVAPPPPPLAQSGAGGRMLCPKCHRDFDPAARFCPHDAATLRRASRAAPGAEFMLSARLVCRTCLQELPLVGAEARVAPASEGVGAADDPAVEVGLGRICPKCAARYAAGVVYCGRDGAELVPVH